MIMMEAAFTVSIALLKGLIGFSIVIFERADTRSVTSML